MKTMTKTMKTAILAACLSLVMPLSANANAIADSTIGQGLSRFLDDASLVLMTWGPGICAIAAGYCFVRKSMADENDGKTWGKRVWIAIFCGVGVFLVGGIINLISSYFVTGTAV